MVLFINDRLVECGALRKAIELVYATILPKASKPFIYMSIHLPPHHVDVNIHPTKREVSFWNQESLVDTIQQAVEAKLLESNNTRMFTTQTLLPGASIVETSRRDSGHSPSPPVIVSQKTPVNKLVRVDSANPAGRLHAFLHKKRSTVDEPSQTENNLAAGGQLSSGEIQKQVQISPVFKSCLLQLIVKLIQDCQRSSRTVRM